VACKGLPIDRIVQSAEGDAVSPSRSAVKADIAFVRADGWTLGAPLDLEAVAYGMWANEWIAWVDLADWRVLSIESYRKERDG
jgi:hypothetical protein